MKLIHITDTHLVTPGETLYDTDPYERLTQCIDDAVSNHSDAAFCVVTGDLADQVTVHFHDYLDRRTLVKVDDHYEYMP